MYCYKIGDIGFGFDTDREILETELYGLFRISEQEFRLLENRHLFTVEEESQEEQDYGTPIFSCSEYAVYKADSGYVKVTNRYDRRKYKCICRQQGQGGEISFTENGVDSLRTSAEFFRIIDVVSALLCFDAFLFHSSVIRHGDRCILFSGFSGAGKSTQADLWHENRAAEILNGDRTLLRYIDGEWFACGVPMCGSSNYCELFMLPVEAVVFLGKAEYNKVTDITAVEKILGMTSQTSCGNRKAEDSEKMLSLIENFINKNTVIKLDCTPDVNAVECLESFLSRK